MLDLQTLFKTHPLPRLEQLTLAAHALEKPRSWLLAHDLDELNVQQQSAVSTSLQRRMAGEPVAYIVGAREFYGLNFTVSPAVLIPRPETELLVDYLIKHTPRGARVLDLGTGSGAIAIALALQRPDLVVFAADISDPALAIAAQNNAALAQNRVNLRRSDWLGAFAGEKFDAIVSNPPYIAASDVHLKQGDLRFEPASALTDFDDGLAHYRSIATQARSHLSMNGQLVFEHGWQQGAALRVVLLTNGYKDVVQHYDATDHHLQGHARMVTAQLNA
jgi:release factor glutamine methyltransferase